MTDDECKSPVDPPLEPSEAAIAEPCRAMDGRWIVLGMIFLAVLLAVIGLAFRQPSPYQQQPATAPATRH